MAHQHTSPTRRHFLTHAAALAAGHVVTHVLQVLGLVGEFLGAVLVEA